MSGGVSQRCQMGVTNRVTGRKRGVWLSAASRGEFTKSTDAYQIRWKLTEKSVRASDSCAHWLGIEALEAACGIAVSRRNPVT